MKFKNWLETMISEKGVDLETDIQIQGHIGLNYNVLIEFLNSLPKHFQAQIKQKLVTIDFMNGDIFHFLKHLANGMIAAKG
jgi:hypothetical protein